MGPPDRENNRRQYTPYSTEGCSFRQCSYMDARRVKENPTKMKPTVWIRLVLVDLKKRIVIAQAGMPRLKANTCLRLVLRRLAEEATDPLLCLLMLATISPPNRPTPSAGRRSKNQRPTSSCNLECS